MRISIVLRSLILRTLPVFVLLVASGARGAQHGAYLGASAGNGAGGGGWQLDPLYRGPTSRESGFKLVGGFRAMDALAVELAYVEFGGLRAPFKSYCLEIGGGPPCLPGHDNTRETRALNATALGLLDLGPVDLFGRVGFDRWRFDRSEHALPGRDLQTTSEYGTGLVVGLGVQYRLGNTTIRVETERCDVAASSLSLSSLGFTYTFGDRSR